MAAIFFGTSMRTRKDGFKYIPVVHEARPAAEAVPDLPGSAPRWAALLPSANGMAVSYSRFAEFDTPDAAIAASEAEALRQGWVPTRDEAAAYADLEVKARVAGLLKHGGQNATVIPPGMTVQQYVRSLAL